MTRYVIDAPTLLHLVTEGIEVGPEHQLVAPSAIRSQALTLLLGAVERGELTEREARVLHTRLTELKIRVLGDRVSRWTSFQIAREQGWATTADAEAFMPADPTNIAFLTQTTLSVDDTAEVVATLQRRFNAIQAPRPDDICYATSNRQTAVKAIAAMCDAMLVIGAPNSSNSVRLVEVAEREGTPARLIHRAADLDLAFLVGVGTLGITAGASAPEILVRELVDRLGEHFTVSEREVETNRETISFKLPRGLEAAAA